MFHKNASIYPACYENDQLFMNFCVTTWMLPVHRIPGGVEYAFSLLTVELNWIT